MADSAAATAAAPAAKGGSSAGHWWKSLTGGKKKHKEAAAAPSPPPPPAAPGPREGATPPFGSGEAPGTGAGGGARRSLRVSHSGRFKETRKARTPLLADSPQVFNGGDPGRAAPGGQ
ncbi:proline-rich protein 15 [Cygnus olor]|uniref:proline-rich protein 15 n=1 Tax=Cygnus olor TaxID=8869 RepID=UPI001ADE2E79|nr:proline-rich protein 15 [Cygnus olor]